MNIDAIQNGFVIDHIPAGKGMKLYELLGLDELDCHIAIIKNANSARMGKKDIIKVDTAQKIDLDVLGYIDAKLTVNVIENKKIVKKFHPELPLEIVDIVKCQNPRCITSTEQELSHVFKLTDKENGVYRCIYCESQAKK